MGCCDCGCDEKKKRRVPLALWVVLGIAVLTVLFWQ